MTTPIPPNPIRIAPITAPTLQSVKPLPASTARTIEPYRVLFPMGALYGAIGVLPWVAAAFGVGGWPWATHAVLMLQGFELCFVTGFLLSAMPAFTHGAPCSRGELATVAAAAALVGLAWAAGLAPVAHAASFVALAACAAFVVRRLRFGGAAPPEEFALVGVGMLLGLTSTAWQALIAAGIATEPAPRFAERLFSRGMVLCLVLGLGGLLATTFMSVREPIRILGVSLPGERPRRRAFVAALAASFVGALVLEALALPRSAAWLRAAAAAASLTLAWKLQRLPGRRDRLSWTLWSAGACVGIGLLGAALAPAYEVAAWHVVFAGGYGLLTAGIATRVVVSHGGHGLEAEPRVLGAAVVTLIAAAVVLRVAADAFASALYTLLAAAALAWAAGWLAWLAGAWPRVRETKRGLLMPAGPAAKR